MDIKILGSGCKKCQSLEETTQRTLDELGIDAPIDHVRDDVDILSYGVMSTPALVIDDQVVISGRVPAPDQVRAAIVGALPET